MAYTISKLTALNMGCEDYQGITLPSIDDIPQGVPKTWRSGKYYFLVAQWEEMPQIIRDGMRDSFTDIANNSLGMRWGNSGYLKFAAVMVRVFNSPNASATVCQCFDIVMAYDGTQNRTDALCIGCGMGSPKRSLRPLMECSGFSAYSPHPNYFNPDGPSGFVKSACAKWVKWSFDTIDHMREFERRRDERIAQSLAALKKAGIECRQEWDNRVEVSFGPICATMKFYCDGTPYFDDAIWAPEEKCREESATPAKNTATETALVS